MNYMKHHMFCLLLLLLFCSSYSQKKPSANSIKASSESPVGPVFKGLATNPVLRIRIYVPGSMQVSTSSIKIKLNDAALKNIDQVETYFNGSEPLFNADNRSGKLSPSSTVFEIPFEQVLKTGLNYIWL